jgi:hypothetical protein
VTNKRRPGEIRDAILAVMNDHIEGAALSEIERQVQERLGATALSSIRSYLRLNTPSLFSRSARGHYALRESSSNPYLAAKTESTAAWPTVTSGNATLYQADCMEWLQVQPRNSIQAVVTDPPYGLFEYSAEQQAKLRTGKGGVWRIPPSFDGSKRSPLATFHDPLTARPAQFGSILL